MQNNEIQKMRNVYELEKNLKSIGDSEVDVEIQKILDKLILDESKKSEYLRFKKGYSIEDLFMRIYSLLPWIKLITPLGQNQFPEDSKKELQVPDYEVIFETGNKENICILIEVKSVNGNKQNFELKKSQYKVLKEYSNKKKQPLLFAIFWKNKIKWTVNSIESFNDSKSSSFKLSFEDAYSNDLSAIFGDYTYIFNKNIYRKIEFMDNNVSEKEYVHIYDDKGIKYDGISLNNKNFDKLDFFEVPVLDSSFDFDEIDKNKNRVIMQYNQKPLRIYRVTTLILLYLLKMYLYDSESAEYNDKYSIVENSFAIVDTVRRKCGGEKYYLLPFDIKDEIKILMGQQFGNVKHIFDVYVNKKREEEKRGKIIILVPHSIEK